MSHFSYQLSVKPFILIPPNPPSKRGRKAQNLSRNFIQLFTIYHPL